jgi:hypothetical protein
MRRGIFDIFKDLLYVPLAEFFVYVGNTEGTAVMGTAESNLQDKTAGLAGRAVDSTFITHYEIIPPCKTNPQSKILYHKRALNVIKNL